MNEVMESLKELYKEYTFNWVEYFRYLEVIDKAINESINEVKYGR